MKVKVLYFASIRETAGISEETIELQTRAQLSTLKEHLTYLHPSLKDHWESTILSVNKKYKNSDIELKDGDEVAILPPISGG
ncbi:MAG: molybdopterin converting factor subunit 1 [Thermoplasmata archaeon]|nr:molybdopterin converting factor subunit 1 [Thermoplasmata archaeon]